MPQQLISGVMASAIYADLISTTTVTNAANSGAIAIPSGYDDFTLRASLVTLTAGAGMALQVSSNGGVSFSTGAGYLWTAVVANSDGTTTTQASAADTGVRIGCGIAFDISHHAKFRVEFGDPSAQAADVCNFVFDAGGYNTAGNLSRGSGAGVFSTSGAAINALRVIPTSGNMTGTLRLYGVRKA